MTQVIINLSVLVFALCALKIIVNHHINKTIYSWCMLIGIVISASSMLVNQKFYSVSFASFASFAAAMAVYVTIKVCKRGRI